MAIGGEKNVAKIHAYKLKGGKGVGIKPLGLLLKAILGHVGASSK